MTGANWKKTVAIAYWTASSVLGSVAFTALGTALGWYSNDGRLVRVPITCGVVALVALASYALLESSVQRRPVALLLATAVPVALFGLPAALAAGPAVIADVWLLALSGAGPFAAAWPTLPEAMRLASARRAGASGA